MKKKAAVIIAALFMSACAPKITETVLMPAGAEGISGIRSIAVLPFDGNYGAKITPSVENVLASAEVPGEQIFYCCRQTEPEQNNAGAEASDLRCGG
ncbi:MAG: hypothetical protein LRY50_00300 [Geovibrio sp.]|nr:hypothetical protein [Geovibrio sp.]